MVAAAGFVAGLLGIGGALIFNPFLLQLGVHPQVVASTAVMIILFGSSSISLSFYFNGLLNTSYAKARAKIMVPRDRKCHSGLRHTVCNCQQLCCTQRERKYCALASAHRPLLASCSCSQSFTAAAAAAASFPLTGSLLSRRCLGPIAFVSSLLGVTVIGYLVRRSGRASIIIILMVRSTFTTLTQCNLHNCRCILVGLQQLLRILCSKRDGCILVKPNISDKGRHQS